MEPVIEYFKDHDDSNIGDAEKFAYALSKIPSLNIKLTAFAQKLEFPVKLAEVTPDIKKVQVACEQILKSKKFIRLMEIVLLIGNYLNKGTNRDKCHGFKFNTLSKLTDTKTGDNKRTLLHYIASITEEKYKEEVWGWEQELEGIPAAAKVAGAQFESDIGALDKMFQDVKKSISSVKEDSNSDFMKIMNTFTVASEGDLSDLKSLFDETNKKYLEVLDYFAEDTKKPQPPEDFFNQFHNL